jgi:peptidoglycan/LPS O-acetylase OafA/YrhL
MSDPRLAAATGSPRKRGHDDRLLELDVLRGLAAVAVVLFHYTVRYGQLYGYAGEPLFRASYGYFGVEFFFCLSGFVIFMTLERTSQPLDFVVSRASRLWPAFIAALLVTFCLTSLFGLKGREVTASQALVNLTMIPELLRVPLVDPVYWSLQVELIFYCWMLAVFTLGLLPRVRLLLGLALVPTVISALAPTLFGRELPYLASVFLIVKYAPFFVIGIAAYRIRMSGARSLPELAIMGAAIAVAATCLSVGEGIVAAMAAATFYAIATGWLRFIALGPLVFLGTISYTLYLVHQNIGYVVMQKAMAGGLRTNAAIALAIVVSVLLAALLTYTVERPGREWLRNRYRKFQVATQARNSARVTAR